MRIAIGQFMQETNTFSPKPTTLESFKDQCLLYGEDVFKYFEGTNSTIGGFMNVAKTEACELVPTVAANAASGGKVTRVAYEFLKADLLGRMERAGEIDGLFLALHGATVVEGIDDVCGDLLTTAREMLGEKLAIAVTLDLHANVTQTMVEASDLIIGYQTYPHIDMGDTGLKAAKLLFQTVRGQAAPAMALGRTRMIVPAENQQTTHGPMAKLMNQAKELEKRDEVLAVSLYPVQPWLDISDVGFSSVVVTDGDLSLAQSEATRLAKEAWAIREQFRVELVSVREAIERALKIEGGPVIFSDSADSTGAGSPGDGTTMLRELLPMKIKERVLLTLVDPEAVSKAVEAGIGKQLSLSVGAKWEKVYNRPVEVTGKVESVSDGRYRLTGRTFTGLEVNRGRTVVLATDGIRLVLTEKSPYADAIDPEFYRSVGLDPEDAKIVVVKSALQFRACYENIAKEMMVVDAPGVSSANLSSLPFKNVTRPMFILDDV